MLKRYRVTPPIGKVFVHDGQRYELIHSRSHQRQDGQSTTILTWQSQCADCGRPFVMTSGLSVTSIIRRCDLHKKPGKPTSGKFNPYYHRRNRRG